MDQVKFFVPLVIADQACRTPVAYVITNDFCLAIWASQKQPMRYCVMLAIVSCLFSTDATNNLHESILRKCLSL